MKVYMVIAALGVAISVNGQVLAGLLSQKNMLVSSGLAYTHYTLVRNADTINLDVLEADLNRVRVGSALAMDQIIGQETVSQMVKRKGALAGVNGGFSFSNDPWNIYHGDPRDLLMYAGKVLSEPLSTRSSFALVEHDGKQIPIFDQLDWKSQFIIAKDTFFVSGLNRRRDSAEIIIYTPEFNRTTLTDETSQEYICRKGRCTREEGGSSIIPQDGFVVSFDSSFDLSVVPRDAPFEWKQVFSARRSLLGKAPTYVWTAGPTLLRNGQVQLDYESESIKPSFGTTHHPRTAVGYNPKSHTLWLVTVDGRRPGWSAGITLENLAQLFLDLGATEAYNLDGGGSTTMSIQGEVVNRFSDAKERRRCDAVLLFSH